MSPIRISAYSPAAPFAVPIEDKAARRIGRHGGERRTFAEPDRELPPATEARVEGPDGGAGGHGEYQHQSRNEGEPASAHQAFERFPQSGVAKIGHSLDSMAMTGAQLIVSALERAGVEVVFGLPGVHNLALWPALADSPIRLVGVRHEQAAGYAADGYARASGNVGVALVTTGPGAANTLGAVGEAWASRSPVVVIATDVPTTLRREGVHRGLLHEVPDQRAMFAPVTKATFRAEDPEELGGLVAEALVAAIAAPSRPVFVEVPTDLLSAEAEAGSAEPRVGG